MSLGVNHEAFHYYAAHHHYLISCDFITFPALASFPVHALSMALVSLMATLMVANRVIAI